MSPDTIFRIASMSKAITSTAVMILADEGRIDLSDPVSRYLPEFKFMHVALPKPKLEGKPDDKNAAAVSSPAYDLVPAYRPITIADLLTDTSGLCYRFRNHPLIGAKYVEANICDGLTRSDHSLAENVPQAREPAAGESAGNGMGIRAFDRRAGQAGRSRIGPVARGILRGADLASAQDERHAFCPSGSEARPAGSRLRTWPGRQDHSHR